MAGTIGHESNQAFGLAQLPQHRFHHVQIGAFVVAAHIVDFALPALAHHQINGSAVVFHIQPVADILALAVYRQTLVVQRPGDHQGDQLLREMIRPVVVGAPGDAHRQMEGAEIGQHQQIGGRLAGRIGRRSMNRRVLGEEQIGPIQR